MHASSQCKTTWPLRPQDVPNSQLAFHTTVCMHGICAANLQHSQTLMYVHTLSNCFIRCVSIHQCLYIHTPQLWNHIIQDCTPMVEFLIAVRSAKCVTKVLQYSSHCKEHDAIICTLRSSHIFIQEVKQRPEGLGRKGAIYEVCCYMV